MKLIEEARRLARLTVARNWGDGGITSYEDGLREMCKRLADALEAATRERAAVPDAATEEALNHIRVTAKANARWRRLANKTIRDTEAERDAALAARDGWAARMGEFTAALAAVERVRAIHVRNNHGLCDECSWEYPETSYDAIDNDVPWPCPTIQALDGAPEPEWQYSRGVLHEGGLLEVGFGLPRDQVVNVRRRKAGPWEPVEGEKP